MVKNNLQDEEFYRLDNILATNAYYYLIIGERTNGKTFAALEYGLKNFIEKGEQTAYVRRWKEDYRGKRGETLYGNLENTGTISQLTNGEWDRVKYYAGRWYLAKFDTDLNKLVSDEIPFAYAFALSDMEHDKSTAYPKITTIIFDEFITRQYYLNDEFVIFMNVCSTIIRRRKNVKIFMLANTVNKYCPYFKEMGLGHVAEMEQGKIDVYTYGNSELRVAVERCAKISKKGKDSDLYFAFDNPALSMITTGAWEINLYPHLMMKYKPEDISFIFFINFDDNLLQCEIVETEDCTFMYIHRKTTKIQNEDEDIIFTEEYSPRPNYFRNIRRCTTKMERRILEYFRRDKVFYQDNEVGEIVRNYMQYCASDKMGALQ